MDSAGKEEAKGEGEGEGGEVEGREREDLQVTVEPGPLRALLRHWMGTQRKHVKNQLYSRISLPTTHLRYNHKQALCQYILIL